MSDGPDRPDDAEAQDDPISEFDAPDGDLEELFTEVESDDVDAEAVWAALDTPGSTHDGDVSGGTDLDEEPVDDAVLGEGDDEAIVSKASYCQRCEYFSGPPDVGCSYPGTRIVELVEVKHFRVRNCPVVAQRQGATVSSLERDDGYGSGGVDGGTEEDGARQSTRAPGESEEVDGDDDGVDDRTGVGDRDRDATR